jgi:ubiquitin-conjugating enzyme E2 C
MMSAPQGLSAFPKDGNMLLWQGKIEGATGTVYEGLSYTLSLDFTGGYPYKSPEVRFETACFHPNVDQHGNICLDILKEKWSACYNVRTILLSIQALLGDPNPDSPLNGHAAELWERNVEEYKCTLLSKYEETQKASG